MNQTERRIRIEQALRETIEIIERYSVKGEEWLRLSGEGEIMARYEQHREKLLGYLAEPQ
jgi:hypothetical protein